MSLAKNRASACQHLVGQKLEPDESNESRQKAPTSKL
jgi:hypothetical protein